MGENRTSYRVSSLLIMGLLVLAEILLVVPNVMAAGETGEGPIENVVPSSAPLIGMPISWVNSPANNSMNRNVLSITGYANVTYPEYITKVEIRIRRNNDTKYWTGSTWGASTWLAASGTNYWSYSATAVTWDSGFYYTVQSRATDNKSNVETPGTGNTFLFDSIKPTSTISTPGNNSVQNTLSSIGGSASDSGGAGVKYVEILLERTNDNKYWGGTNWSISKSWLRTTGKTSWSYTTYSYMWNIGSKYRVQSRATDNAYNTEVPSWGTIFYIQTPGFKVSSSISVPANNSLHNKLNSISGIASAPSNASVTKVEICIKNLTSTSYWSGSGWTGTETWLTATGTVSWSYNSASVIWVSNTKYLIRSKATDNKSNTESPSYGNEFRFDNIKPTSTITSPTNNSALDSLTTITGTASDTGGAGVYYVQICLIRNKDGYYWNGWYWTNNETWLTVSGTTSWTYTHGNTSLSTPGSYHIKSRAVDLANNIETPSYGNIFTIKGVLGSKINMPVHNSYRRVLNSIYGTATATFGLVVSKVEISIKRNSDTKFWTGSGWTTGTETWLLTSGTTSWSYNSASVTWDAGKNYRIRSRAEDNKTNKETPSTGNLFYFDDLKPTSNIISPANNTNVSSLTRITGNASDTGGSGVLYVNICVMRYSDGWYWDGYQWNGTQTWLRASGSTSWDWDYYLNRSWANGKYHIQSKATDKAGNVESPSFGNVFYIGPGPTNKTKPSSAISAPAPGAFLNTVSSISGTAIDNSGSGLKRVEVSIKRMSDYKYWDGSLWKASEQWLAATGTSSWSYDCKSVKWTTDVNFNIRSRAVDKKDNVEDPGTGNTFMFDSEPPKSVSVSINSGAKYTKSRTVSLTLQASDSGSGVWEMAFSTDDGKTWSTWESYSRNKSFKLPGGDGEKTVHFKVKDRANNVASANDSIILNTKSSMSISFIVNNANIYTNTPKVNLYIEIKNIISRFVKIAFSNDGVQWTEWMDFELQSTRAESGYITTEYILPPGDGQKIIHYKIQDEAGNTEEYLYDNIILDTTPPEELTVMINDGDEYTNSDSATLSVDAKDSLSGINEMSISTDGETWTTWEPFDQEKSLTLPPSDGEKTVYVRVTDGAENMREASDNIVLDSSSPYSLAITINNGAEETDSEDVTLQLYAIDDTSGLEAMSFSTDGNVWTPWEPFRYERPFTLPTNDGEKTIYFSVRDGAGNIAQPVITTITLKTPEQIKDSDHDGIPNENDAFPNDPAASIDSDGDNSPDYWNPGKTEADSTSNLHLDAFPDDPAASVDSDGDQYPDDWNPGMSEEDSTTGLKRDAYPNDPERYMESKGADKTESFLFPIILAIVVVIIVVLIISFVVKNRHRRADEGVDENKILYEIRNEILNGELPEGSILSDDEINRSVEDKYWRGEISENTYYYLKNNK
ncbi:hypothetical protein [[Eubacterium] cellulosolvens]